MAKRKEDSTRGEAGSTGESMEQRVLAFAEQIGRIYGTVQAKAEGWLDRDKLNAEIESLRDNATELLAQIGAKMPAAGKSGGSTRAAKGSTATARPVKTARPAEDTAPAPKRAAGAQEGCGRRQEADEDGRCVDQRRDRNQKGIRPERRRRRCTGEEAPRAGAERVAPRPAHRAGKGRGSPS